MGPKILGSFMMDKSLNYDYNKYSTIFGKNKGKSVKKGWHHIADSIC